MPEGTRQGGQAAKFVDDAINVGLGLRVVLHGAHLLRKLRRKSTWKTYDPPQKLRAMGTSVPRALQYLRKRAGLTMEELARRGDFKSASSVQRYLSEDDFKERYLPPKTARRFAKSLVGLGEPPILQAEVMLLAGPEFANQPTIHVPLIDFVEAGEWAEVVDPYPAGEGSAIPASAQVGKRSFALRIRGRSMEPTYFDGDVIIVDPDVQPVPGDDVVAKLLSEQEATFKRYRVRSPKEVELLPLNDLHPTLTLSSKNPGRIVGVMVEHHRYRRR